MLNEYKESCELSFPSGLEHRLRQWAIGHNGRRHSKHKGEKVYTRESAIGVESSITSQHLSHSIQDLRLARREDDFQHTMLPKTVIVLLAYYAIEGEQQRVGYGRHHDNNTFQVFVRNLDAKIITIKVNNRTTIDDVKNKISEKTGMSTSQMRLVFKGKYLTDGIIRDYGIRRESTIEMMGRLRGG
eukprot:Seg564.1 transcript_id=Seg564.1/GoldUCD/mRNA.D3Y31 product="Ubiquitin-60S ribosomal protein L40" pseudo=true protein_id=Seg564.1/GoldUCD/D3Y31